MTIASITIFDSLPEYVGDGTINLSADTFKATLHNSSEVLSASGQTVYADLSHELATANGYTSGGLALSGITWTRSGSLVTWDATDAQWTASGGSIVHRYLVVRKVGTANGITDPLVFFILADVTPADVTTPDGQVLSYIWHSSGIVLCGNPNA